MTGSLGSSSCVKMICESSGRNIFRPKSSSSSLLNSFINFILTPGTSMLKGDNELNVVDQLYISYRKSTTHEILRSINSHKPMFPEFLQDTMKFDIFLSCQPGFYHFDVSFSI